ncbi:hypothetical protein AC249_AIPGENE26017 [Exaiptasia diaphana]|nr:hypothetical protein AC249_AIPGENE26017 [Exaiptasia diaphana]
MPYFTFPNLSINRQRVQQIAGIVRLVKKVPNEHNELNAVSNSQQMLLCKPVCQESAEHIHFEQDHQQRSPNDVCEEIRECIVEKLD